MTILEILYKHWKEFWKKDPNSENMDLDIGTFEEELRNNDDFKWILPAIAEKEKEVAVKFAAWLGSHGYTIGAVDNHSKKIYDKYLQSINKQP